MAYLKIIVFLTFSLSLFLFPWRLYKNVRFRKVWLGMAYSEKFRLFVARLLCLIVILFHLTYFALFPTDKGIMLSSLYVFFALASNKNVKLLHAIRQSHTAICILALAAVAMYFTPHMLSTGITLAFILVSACCYPSKVKQRNCRIKLQS